MVKRDSSQKTKLKMSMRWSILGYLPERGERKRNQQLKIVSLQYRLGWCARARGFPACITHSLCVEWILKSLSDRGRHWGIFIYEVKHHTTLYWIHRILLRWCGDRHLFAHARLMYVEDEQKYLRKEDGETSLSSSSFYD